MGGEGSGAFVCRKAQIPPLSTSLEAPMMKSIAIVLAGTALLWNPALALADEASKTAKIEEMMQLSNMDRMTTQMMDQVKTMLSSQLSSIPAEARQAADEMQQKMMKLLADRLNWDKAKPAYIKLYSETFTESEIDGIVGFYKSPSGQAMLSKMPVLMQKSMAVGQQLMGDVMPEIERMAEELKQKYQK
jgi:hypothetical protein